MRGIRIDARCSKARQQAFSLVEVMAVLALSAIVVAIGASAFDQWKASTDIKDATERVGSADALLRLQAQASGRSMVLLFSADAGAIQRRSADLDSQPRAIGRLPTDVRIDRMLPEPTDGAMQDAGVVISPAGRSRSYAVLLVGRDDRRQWIGVAGLTGQVVELADEDQAEQLVGDAGPSNDAH